MAQTTEVIVAAAVVTIRGDESWFVDTQHETDEDIPGNGKNDEIHYPYISNPWISRFMKDTFSREVSLKFNGLIMGIVIEIDGLLNNIVYL